MGPMNRVVFSARGVGKSTFARLLAGCTGRPAEAALAQRRGVSLRLHPDTRASATSSCGILIASVFTRP
jgi:FAD/FMN-containing dehydrogenase